MAILYRSPTIMHPVTLFCRHSRYHLISISGLWPHSVHSLRFSPDCISDQYVNPCPWSWRTSTIFVLLSYSLSHSLPFQTTGSIGTHVFSESMTSLLSAFYYLLRASYPPLSIILIVTYAYSITLLAGYRTWSYCVRLHVFAMSIWLLTLHPPRPPQCIEHVPSVALPGLFASAPFLAFP